MRICKFDELRVRMFAKHLSVRETAARIGIDGTTLQLKLNGRTDFSIREAYALAELLEFEAKDFPIYFPKEV